MAIKRNKRFHVEVATSALSDIMFFLLLFFLIISTLANPNVIKMDLPKASAPDHTPQQHLTVSVTAEKKFFIDKEEVPFDQLEQKLIYILFIAPLITSYKWFARLKAMF